MTEKIWNSNRNSPITCEQTLKASLYTQLAEENSLYIFLFPSMVNSIFLLPLILSHSRRKKINEPFIFLLKSSVAFFTVYLYGWVLLIFMLFNTKKFTIFYCHRIKEKALLRESFVIANLSVSAFSWKSYCNKRTTTILFWCCSICLKMTRLDLITTIFPYNAA